MNKNEMMVFVLLSGHVSGVPIVGQRLQENIVHNIHVAEGDLAVHEEGVKVLFRCNEHGGRDLFNLIVFHSLLWCHPKAGPFELLLP
jgi:hypothetical protein